MVEAGEIPGDVEPVGLGGASAPSRGRSPIATREQPRRERGGFRHRPRDDGDGGLADDAAGRLLVSLDMLQSHLACIKSVFARAQIELVRALNMTQLGRIALAHDYDRCGIIFLGAQRDE